MAGYLYPRRNLQCFSANCKNNRWHKDKKHKDDITITLKENIQNEVACQKSSKSSDFEDFCFS